ncbi:MAG: nucleotidyltransferase domain-containing protein [Candidatus Hydrogenedentes bacterium]|nr:nucleotidyltransferase domain-containing protein [Candidatus Hydrogenedentota bacterium]
MEKLVLFGSYARGEAEPDSDIDVMVALRDPVDVHEEILRSEHIVAALSLEFDTVLSCAFVSTSRFDAEQSPLLINVRHEGVAI